MPSLAEHLPFVEAPEPHRSGKGPWIGLLGLSLSVLVVLLTETSVNVALPDIGRDLHATIVDYTWILDILILVMGTLTLPGARLGDLFGRRRIYLSGVGIFVLGSAFAALAPNVLLLIMARSVMGVGAAIILPGTLALISTMFEGEQRATAIGVWGGLNGAEVAIGPIIGGFLVALVSWRAVFWVNVPIALVAVPLVLRYVPPARPEEEPQQVDWAGALALSVAMFGLIFGLIEATSAGWLSLLVLAPFGGAVMALAIFSPSRCGRGSQWCRSGCFGASPSARPTPPWLCSRSLCSSSFSSSRCTSRTRCG